MIELIIDKNDVCLARYVNELTTPINLKIKISMVCGNCNLSFTTDRYYECNSKIKTRYITSCIHCGKWNKINLYTKETQSCKYITR